MFREEEADSVFYEKHILYNYITALLLLVDCSERPAKNWNSDSVHMRASCG
jgi:hypothetical protein